MVLHYKTLGVGKINENGQHLLELCSLFNLSIARSFFEGLLRSKVTWMHPLSLMASI